MKSEKNALLNEQIVALLSGAPETVWRVGALYDKLRPRWRSGLRLRNIERVLDSLAKQQKVAVHWEMYNVQMYRWRV